MRRAVLPLLSLLLALVAAAPAAAQSNARYELVRGCYTLQSGGKPVFKTAAGYATVGTGSPEVFRMQATTLGRYLLYGRDKDFLASDGGSGVRTDASPGLDADWEVAGDGPAFTLVNQGSGKGLATDAAGRLVQVDKGAAAQFTFAKAQGCPDFPEADINATGESPKGPTPWGEVSGLIDAHMHHMAFEFLGGGAHCGRPWSPYGVAVALQDCPDHASGVAPLDTALGGKARHDPVGWPTFVDWPAWNSLTHEQSYYRWIERAWRGGLRVFVNLLVDNKALCDVYPIKKRGCNEMDTVRLEAKAIKELQDYIDAQAGGPGKGFYRIVKTPFEARQVINDGKLAVVLGIEVSQLFDCNVYNDVPTCDRAQVEQRLQEAYDMGVRDMELINKFDNAFGGVAGDNGQTGVVVNQGNKKETGRYWQLQHCEEPADREQLSPSDHNTDALIGNGLQTFLPPGTAPIYPSAPQCNVRGLSALGEYLVTKMMDKGMIVDPDHLSVLARRQVLNLLEARRYSGVISSHSWSTDDSYPRVYGLGGMVTPYAGASTSFVRQWRERKKERDPRFYWGFGYGADMNGFGAQGPPRPDAAKNPVTYPFKSYDGRVTFERNRTGQRVWDINKDGVAQYGLYPDWVEDLRKVAGQEIIDDMARGAEAYLQMWERAQGVPNRRCQPARTRFRATRFGLLRLGDSYEALLRSAGQPFDRGPLRWTWCVPGRGKLPDDGKVVSVLSPAGTVALVGSSGPESSALGVGRGDRARRLASKGAKTFGSGVRIKRLKGGTAYVWRVRKGRVRWVALASRQVAGRRSELRKYLKLAAL